MLQTILSTKLFIPHPQPRAIIRPRLLERLNDGLHRKLTLISAPAGFGKTTLVSEWLAGCNRPAAWLSLDGEDSDPTRFLTYLIAAVQRVAPEVGAGLQGVLISPQPPSPESILTVLINELASGSHEIVLVLDDYHLVNSRPVDDALGFLIEHLPPQLHLVISTREDPQLPLPGLRARGHLNELRAVDMRFTLAEATAFLNQTIGLDLSADDVAALDRRTEGWIAGLQLAALSMRGREDAAGFIRQFAGDDRYIVDYLVEEVLRRQPAEVRRFLLATSMLERLGGSLCNAVTGRDDSSSLLDSLERSNLFVMPLDDKRQWYRYHHLFADVLQTHAMEEEPKGVARRHLAASAWFEQQGDIPASIRHALAADDAERAAGLIERSALHMLGGSGEDSLWEWLEAIPDDLACRMPVLSVYYGFASLGHAGLDAAEARFRDAERWLDRVGDDLADGMIVVNDAAFRSAKGAIAVGRAYCAGALGNVEEMLAYARKALEVTPDDEHLWSGAASSVLGIAHWTVGELDLAYRCFEDGKRRLEQAGYTQFQVVSVHILADIRLAQGRLREAERIYEQALAIATKHGDPAWGTVDLYVGLSEICCERNDLDAATRYLSRSKELGDHAGLMDTRHRWYIAMAKVREGQGDMDGALAMLDEAARQYVPGADPYLRPVAAQKARLWVVQGRVQDARAWARERGLSADDPLSYLQEFEHLTLARVLIARFREKADEDAIREAIRLLDRLMDAAETGQRTGSVIEILVARVLAYEAIGDLPAAMESLGRALSLAGPEGYVRVFTGEGAPMVKLLAKANAAGIRSGYTGKLLAAFASERDNTATGPEPQPQPEHASPHVTETLSRRELEVLRLVAEGLSNKEISERLFLSLSTVKGHNRVIFSKLQVQRRTEAVARARELGLL